MDYADVLIAGLLVIVYSVAFGFGIASLAISADDGQVSSAYGLYGWCIVFVVILLLAIIHVVVKFILRQISEKPPLAKKIENILLANWGKLLIFSLLSAMLLWGIYIYGQLGNDSGVYVSILWKWYRVMLWTDSAVIISFLLLYIWAEGSRFTSKSTSTVSTTGTNSPAPSNDIVIMQRV